MSSIAADTGGFGFGCRNASCDISLNYRTALMHGGLPSNWGLISSFSRSAVCAFVSNKQRVPRRMSIADRFHADLVPLRMTG
jgi:hypothetical protein